MAPMSIGPVEERTRIGEHLGIEPDAVVVMPVVGVRWIVVKTDHPVTVEEARDVQRKLDALELPGWELEHASPPDGAHWLLGTSGGPDGTYTATARRTYRNGEERATSTMRWVRSHPSDVTYKRVAGPEEDNPLL